MNVVQFIRLFTEHEVFAGRDIITISNHVFAASGPLRKLVSSNQRSAFAAGIYLGTQGRQGFIPGFQLLDALMPLTERKVILKEKASWLFVCGRDALPKGVEKAPEGLKDGDLVLLENSRGECLGLGEWRADKKLAVRNVLDRGDFLRRERSRGFGN